MNGTWFESFGQRKRFVVPAAIVAAAAGWAVVDQLSESRPKDNVNFAAVPPAPMPVEHVRPSVLTASLTLDDLSDAADGRCVVSALHETPFDEEHATLSPGGIERVGHTAPGSKTIAGPQAAWLAGTIEPVAARPQ